MEKQNTVQGENPNDQIEIIAIQQIAMNIYGDNSLTLDQKLNKISELYSPLIAPKNNQ